MDSHYQFIIPRLNGENIRKEFSGHLSLVEKGIAGFIVFGGRLKEVRRHLHMLQEASELPLIIAADLERGLGQQLRGGTLFPPAMALAKAAERKDARRKGAVPGNGVFTGKGLTRLRQSFQALAEEARYAGINTILAPVLDINTNPDNPIIGVRSFGEESDTVSFFGEEMIRTLRRSGIAACGKHFPGHGDTAVDSHISLPTIRRTLASLSRSELRPFRRAVAAGVAMMMLGHLEVPGLDPSGTPVSLSARAVSYIRDTMHYKGLLITDAMNMGGLSGFSEEEASLMALRAGVDIILHPLHAERVAAYLKEKKFPSHNPRLTEFRRDLPRYPDKQEPHFEEHALLSHELAAGSLSLPKGLRISPAPLVLILSDEKEVTGREFITALRKGLPGLSCNTLEQKQGKSGFLKVAGRAAGKGTIITAVFSETRAWKGQTGQWMQESIAALNPLTSLFVSFGNPYLLRNIPEGKKMSAYWNAPLAQQAAAEAIIRRYRP